MLAQLGLLLEAVDHDELIDTPNIRQITSKFRASSRLFNTFLKTLYGKYYTHIEASDGSEKQALFEKGILAPQELVLLIDQFTAEVMFEYPATFEIPGSGGRYRECAEAIPVYHEMMSSLVLRIEDYGL